jgi:hypothetical protein
MLKKTVLYIGISVLNMGLALPKHHAYLKIMSVLKQNLKLKSIYIPTDNDTQSLIGSRQLNIQQLQINKATLSYKINFAAINNCNGSSSCSNGSLSVTPSNNQQRTIGSTKHIQLKLGSKEIKARLNQRGTFGQLYALNWNYNDRNFLLQAKSLKIINIAQNILTQGAISI